MPDEGDIPCVEKVPDNVRHYVKRRAYPNQPNAIGFLVDVGSEEKPLLIIARNMKVCANSQFA